MQQRLDVKILDRDYSLSCTSDQRQALQNAVDLANKKMQNLKDGGKIIGNERIAVMVAVQLALELLSAKAPDGPLANIAVGDINSKIQKINDLIDQAQTI